MKLKKMAALGAAAAIAAAMMAGCGKMILGSDSHTRYGALGTMAIGEGGGELGRLSLSSREMCHALVQISDRQENRDRAA